MKTARYNATDDLRLTIDAQGRKLAWVSGQAEIPPSLFRHVVIGDRTLGKEQAQRVGWVLGQDWKRLFTEKEQDKA